MPSGLDFMFCAPGLFFGGTEGVGSCFLVLCSLTRFRRYRGRRGSISCLALPDTFCVVCRASGHVFMFCAPELFFDGTEGVDAHFHVLTSRTLFGRYRGRHRSFSCFALSDSFWAVPWISGTIFMFCALGLVFDSTEGVGSLFHSLRSQNLFGRYRGRRVLFSCFALPDSFWVVPRPSGLIFMFCAAGLSLGGIEGAGSRFHVLRSRTHFGQYRGRQVLFFMFYAPGLVFDGTEGVGSRFHVLPSRTLFGRYQGCQVPFLSFSLLNSFSKLSRASGHIFIVCGLGLFLGDIEGVRSHFQVFLSLTRFGRHLGCWVLFSCFALPDSFWGLYRRREVPFSCFALSESFGDVPRATGPVFMF
jgi:hypothetical protein